jgi:hypothetical protein
MFAFNYHSANVDYSAACELAKTKLDRIRYLDVTKKGLLTIGLRKCPGSHFQLSPAGSLNLYSGFLERGLAEIELVELLPTTNGEPLRLELKPSEALEEIQHYQSLIVNTLFPQKRYSGLFS